MLGLQVDLGKTCEQVVNNLAPDAEHERVTQSRHSLRYSGFLCFAGRAGGRSQAQMAGFANAIHAVFSNALVLGKDAFEQSFKRRDVPFGRMSLKSKSTSAGCCWRNLR